jgi:anti-sigma regulatory factor (Ser/Thr protein kinase)
MLPDQASDVSMPPRPAASLPDLTLAMGIAATQTAARRARRAVQWRFADLLGTEALEDVVLVVSELVTNAVVHGHGEIRLRLAFDGQRVSGTVSDDGRGFARHVGARDRAQDGGYGLDIVEDLSAGWGVRPKTSDVWFEVLVA